MTKKQFQQIANTFRKTKPTMESGYLLRQWEEDILAIANMLQRNYPRFKRLQFLEACGYYDDN